MEKKRSKATVRKADRAPDIKPTRAKPSSARRLSVSDVVSALYVEHRYAGRLLDVLDEQIDAAARGQKLDGQASLAVMHYMTQYPDAYHHPREDAMFVRLVKRDPHLAKRIAEVKRAHRTIGSAGKKLLAALQRLEESGEGDEAGVVSLMSDYASALRDHMAIEERDLFPRAREVLDVNDLEEIDRAFARVIDPIFEAELRDAYAAYRPVVRYLVDQPSVRQAFAVLETFYDSALTLGEMLFGAGAGTAPTRDEARAAPPRARRALRAAPRRRG